MAVLSASAALVLMLVYCLQVTSGSSGPEIIQSFEDVTSALGQGPVTQTCVIRGDILFMRVNTTLVDHITRGPLEDRGISFSNQQFYPNGTSEQSVTITATAMNNNTVIQCVASSTSEGILPAFSDNATFLVAGPPLAPSLSLETVNESALQVSWEEPFSLEFPIIRYGVEIIDFISGYEEEFNVSADTHSFTYTTMNLSVCTNLTFKVYAASEVGKSPCGEYAGAFSSFPGQIESPSSEVTFFRNQAPILHLNFTFPSLCPFTNASYSIYINEYGSGELVDVIGPVVLPWQMSNMEVVMTMEENSLKLNARYNGNITVSTDIGHTSAYFEIDTSHDLLPTVDTSPHTSRPDKNWIYWIVAACVGTAIAMSLAALLVVFIIYIHNRSVKRKRDCRHTTELAAHVGRGMPMVVNPIYEGGDTIYEEIPGELDYKEPLPFEREEGYVSISTSATLNSAAEKMNGEKGRDEMYTKMDSVGTLMGHLRGGGGASAMGSPDQPGGATAAGFFPSTCDGSAASANWQPPEQDGRYVIIN